MFCSAKLLNLSDYKYCNANLKRTVVSSEVVGNLNGCGTKQQFPPIPSPLAYAVSADYLMCLNVAWGFPASFPEGCLFEVRKVFWLF